MNDSLEIMNNFMARPITEQPFPRSEYWEKKVAALCAVVADLRNENKRLRESKIVLDFIKNHPGKYADDIATALEIPVLDIVEITKELIEEGLIKQGVD